MGGPEVLLRVSYGASFGSVLPDVEGDGSPSITLAGKNAPEGLPAPIYAQAPFVHRDSLDTPARPRGVCGTYGRNYLPAPMQSGDSGGTKGGTEGLYSPYVLVPKKNGGSRPILELRVLNGFVTERRFHMLTVRHLLECVRQGDWMTSLDLTPTSMFPLRRNTGSFFALRFRTSATSSAVCLSAISCVLYQVCESGSGPSLLSGPPHPDLHRRLPDLGFLSPIGGGTHRNLAPSYCHIRVRGQLGEEHVAPYTTTVLPGPLPRLQGFQGLSVAGASGGHFKSRGPHAGMSPCTPEPG